MMVTPVSPPPPATIKPGSYAGYGSEIPLTVVGPKSTEADIKKAKALNPNVFRDKNDLSLPQVELTPNWIADHTVNLNAELIHTGERLATRQDLETLHLDQSQQLAKASHLIGTEFKLDLQLVINEKTHDLVRDQKGEPVYRLIGAHGLYNGQQAYYGVNPETGKAEKNTAFLIDSKTYHTGGTGLWGGNETTVKDTGAIRIPLDVLAGDTE